MTTTVIQRTLQIVSILVLLCLVPWVGYLAFCVLFFKLYPWLDNDWLASIVGLLLVAGPVLIVLWRPIRTFMKLTSNSTRQ